MKSVVGSKTHIHKYDHVSINQLSANTTLPVNINDLQLLNEFAPHFAKFGWTYEIIGDRSIRVQSVGCVFGKILSPFHLLQYVNELAELCSRYHEHISLPIPRSLNEILASLACRTAVMFGDPLSHQECVNLLRQLSKTRNPFVCAHGRPTITPLCKLRTGISASNHQFSK